MRSSALSVGDAGTPLQYNNLFKDAAGSGQLCAHQQRGILAMPTNPSNNQTLTLTINGTAIVITFVSAIGITANTVVIGSTAAITAANLLAFLQNSQTISPTQVGTVLASQNLISYLSYSLNGTNINISYPNNSSYAPLSSLSVSTTVTGATWTANLMALFVEPGFFTLSSAQPNVYLGGSSPTFTAPVANPRIDILTIDSSGTLAITQGSENASPTAPAYPVNKIVLCEVYNVVGETSILNNDNQTGGQGYIYKDSRWIITDMYFNSSNQFANGVIADAALASSFLHAGGTVAENETGILTFTSVPVMPGNPSGNNDMANKTYAVAAFG